MSHALEGFLQKSLEETADLLPRVREMTPVILQIADAMVAAWDRGGKIIFAGNGGSAADAMHFAEELVVRYHRDRKALAAIALLDSTVITCAGNDLGYDRIFSRQIEALAKPEDVFFGLSTSGNSTNIRLAFESARKIGAKTIGFLGKDGGACKALCDIALIIPSPRTARIQEMHKLIYHCICDYIDAWALGEIS